MRRAAHGHGRSRGGAERGTVLLQSPGVRAAVDAGVHCADLGGNTEIVFQQKELDAEAKHRNVSVIPDCGLAPGMVNVLAAEGIRRVGDAESVKIYVGGLPQHPSPAQLPDRVLARRRARLLHDAVLGAARWQAGARRRPFRARARDVSTTGGQLEAFHTGGGISTLPWAYEGKVRTMEYKTLRYRGNIGIMRPIRELGLLDLTP